MTRHVDVVRSDVTHHGRSVVGEFPHLQSHRRRVQARFGGRLRPGLLVDAEQRGALFARDRAGGLEGFHDGEVGAGVERPQSRAVRAVCSSETDEQRGSLGVPDQSSRATDPVLGGRAELTR
ncbi:hypothetical protein [Streptomyces sp. NPDC001089]